MKQPFLANFIHLIFTCMPFGIQSTLGQRSYRLAQITLKFHLFKIQNTSNSYPTIIKKRSYFDGCMESAFVRISHLRFLLCNSLFLLGNKFLLFALNCFMPSEYEHKNEIEHRRHNKESILLNFFLLPKKNNKEISIRNGLRVSSIRSKESTRFVKWLFIIQIYSGGTSIMRKNVKNLTRISFFFV